MSAPHQYDASYVRSWDLPHEPTGSAHWQESDCYWAYDLEQGVGVFHRIGQFVNRGTGQLMLFVFEEGGQRFLLQTTDLRDHTLRRWETGQRVGSSQVDALPDARMRYRWSESDSAADLEFYTTFYAPRGWKPGEINADYYRTVHDGGHLECSGRIRGSVRIGSKEIDIDALAHRDRSWGVRGEVKNYQHRMCTGTTGPEFSWVTVLLQFAGGRTTRLGFVVRDGVAEEVVGLDVPTTIDYDSVSVIDALVKLQLASGERIDIAATTQQAFVATLGSQHLSPQSIMSVEHAGYRGFCYHTASLNAARGSYVPAQSEVSSACIQPGLSTCVAPRR
jgi:hypothetical protein